MADLRNYPDAVWDRFFDFAFSEATSCSRNEVQEELKSLGIDLGKAMVRVRQAIQTAKAKEELAAARAKRPGLVKALRSLVGPEVASLREKLQEVIGQRSSGTVQAAYFRKLKEAANENDLQSLLEDMVRLEAFEKEPGDATRTDQ
jgi:hypothetical protein